MRIRVVQLENIRSHEKTAVLFSRGFNCLVGGLGRGKSSILYSIDFALFGEPLGRSYDYLLREGAESGKVILEFVQNDREYKISRGLKRHSKGITQDIDELKLYEDGNLISSLKAEAVAEQLNAVTGWDKDLFREIVWVRQEQLKKLLDATPRERQRRLDELFGLSDYERAWSSLAGHQREYDGERKAYEKDADLLSLQKLTLEYDQAAESFLILESEIENVTRMLTKSKKALEKAEVRLRNLEELKASTDKLGRKQSEVDANLSNVRVASESIAMKNEEKRIAVKNLKKRLKSMEVQIRELKSELKGFGLPADQPVGILRESVSKFIREIGRLRGEEEAALRMMRTNSEKILALSTENLCPFCLQPLTSDYKKDFVAKIEEENEEHHKSVKRLRQEIMETEEARRRVDTAFSDLHLLFSRVGDTRARIDEDLQSLAELSRELQEKKTLEQTLLEQLDALQLEVSKFDTSKLETAKNEREEALRSCMTLGSDLMARESSRKDLARRLDEMKERIDSAQQKVERIDKIARIVQVMNDIRDAYRSIQPRLRSEFVRVLRSFIQQVLDSLTSEGTPTINVSIDENYTPYVRSEEGFEREVSNLSGGERTLLAFSYRLGLGQLIMQSKTGRGLTLLLLDEPTESLGSEDGSVSRLADAISHLKAIEQIVAVTHSEAFAEKADHVIRMEREFGASKISMEK